MLATTPWSVLVPPANCRIFCPGIIKNKIEFSLSMHKLRMFESCESRLAAVDQITSLFEIGDGIEEAVGDALEDTLREICQEDTEKRDAGVLGESWFVRGTNRYSDAVDEAVEKFGDEPNFIIDHEELNAYLLRIVTVCPDDKIDAYLTIVLNRVYEKLLEFIQEAATPKTNMSSCVLVDNSAHSSEAVKTKKEWDIKRLMFRRNLKIAMRLMRSNIIILDATPIPMELDKVEFMNTFDRIYEKLNTAAPVMEGDGADPV
jgi:hypothetical protein